MPDAVTTQELKELSEKLGEKLDDALSYPALPQAAGAAARPGPGAGTVGQIAERTLRDILGWRPRASDAKGFAAALDQAFVSKAAEGRTEWQWRQRGYTVQADLGAITGAQASIYSRAKAALDDVLPLLDGLKPLRVDADPEDLDAIRAIVRTELTQLVDELGAEGGPRVQRVDQLLLLLLGYDPGARNRIGSSDPEKIGGQLGTLRKRFGLTRDRVNTVLEEQNLTNFVILVDHVGTLAMSWAAQRRYFDRRGTDVYFGTHLILLNRALEVVAESVQEVEEAMDSVNLGLAERQTLTLDSAPPLTVAELLEWVERFATEEGPTLLEDGGKDGVALAFRPTVKKLRKLVQGEMIQKPNASFPASYHTARVRRSLRELATYLARAETLASQIVGAAPGPAPSPIPRPVVDTVMPQVLPNSQPAVLVIVGANFRDGVRLRLAHHGEPDIPGVVRSVRGAKEIFAIFEVTRAKPGDWTLVAAQGDHETSWSPVIITSGGPPPAAGAAPAPPSAGATTTNPPGPSGSGKARTKASGSAAARPQTTSQTGAQATPGVERVDLRSQIPTDAQSSPPGDNSTSLS